MENITPTNPVRAALLRRGLGYLVTALVLSGCAVATGAPKPASAPKPPCSAAEMVEVMSDPYGPVEASKLKCQPPANYKPADLYPAAETEALMAGVDDAVNYVDSAPTADKCALLRVMVSEGAVGSLSESPCQKAGYLP